MLKDSKTKKTMKEKESMTKIFVLEQILQLKDLVGVLIFNFLIILLFLALVCSQTCPAASKGGFSYILAIEILKY